ncbi:preprotein translocase subunit SecG [Gemmatimonadota bacterium]
MSFLYTPMLILFIVDSVLLMIVILLQDSKGQGLAGAFGGGGFSTSMFGGRGAATFLSKATTFLGTAFLVLAIFISLIPRQSRQAESLIMESAQQEQQLVPETGLPLLPGSSSLPATSLPTAAPPDTGGTGL